ncbi:sigma-70 family RNA polymerase sigma factor [Agrococcus sp. SCSIO52902]|uniref:RNA polymerase sigma factor n=1 Tax=Agrococcus sp. SCSIO52902 TaxID=2933290 RepID=UPI001FF3F12D|nr:sigma-70 family RNA polymerase sigma factor [Agrococcus sp. SCSIO52902]UOV99940.1 sigma-70 family RNA polymerase sigma factor [Agrococcus sp. SCSIO52902]
MAERDDRLTALVADAADDLLGYFLRRVPAPEDAADLLGETLLALAAGADRIPHAPVDARRWAFGVARRTLLAGRRRHVQRAQRDAARIDALRMAAIDAAGHPGSDRDLERRRVREAVQTLPERDRELLMLVHWDGFSLQEAARHLGIRPSTASTRHARAKAALRVLLAAAPSAAAEQDPDPSVRPGVAT